MLTALFVLLALGVVVPQTASADTRPVLRVAALSGTVSTAAGVFRVTGVASVAAPACSAIPNDPCRFLTAVAAVATDTDTGRRCVVADAVPVDVVRDVPTTIGASYRVVPSNPISPVDPCRQLARVPVTFGLAFTADGTLSTLTAAPRAPAP